MITIHNDIDKHCYADVYHNGEFIGRCENELALLDVRVQIAEKELSGYSIKFEDKTTRIDHNGNLENYLDGLWESRVDMLCKLV